MERRSDSGFTLLEVIVALAVAVACLASLYQVYSLGWRGVRLAGLDQAAIEVARNQLASAGVEVPMEEGEVNGVSPDGVAWTMEIHPYIAPDGFEPGPSFAEPSVPTAYRVKVRVAWREGPDRRERTLELETIKLKTGP